MSVLEKLSSNQVKLTIDVDAELFKHAIEHVYPEVAKDAKIDGFRPGKAPMSIFIRHYGYEPIYEKAVSHAIEHTYRDAVEEHKLAIVDYPKIDVDYATISHDQGFTYTATVYVMPDVELVKYTGFDIEPLSTKVSKQEIEDAIKNALNNKAENVIKEDIAEMGDTVVIDFEGFIDDKPFEGGKGENYDLVLGSGSFIPGFEDQLLGTKAEDEVDVNVTFPENYHAELAGKDATFKVKVHEVKQKVVPTLDDELVAEMEIEGVKTVDEYKTYTENNLKASKAKQAEEDFENKLFTKLVEQNPVDIPQVMIDNYAKELEERYHRQAEQYKIPFDMFLQFQGLTEADFQERMKLQAKNQIHLDLVIEAITNKEQFEVSDDAVEKEMQKLAEANNITLEQVKQAVVKEDIVYHIKRELAVEFLKANNKKAKATKKSAPKESK